MSFGKIVEYDTRKAEFDGQNKSVKGQGHRGQITVNQKEDFKLLLVYLKNLLTDCDGLWQGGVEW